MSAAVDAAQPVKIKKSKARIKPELLYVNHCQRVLRNAEFWA